MDLTLAKIFLQQLDQSEDPIFAFRTFSDNKEIKDPTLTVNRYGKFDDIKDELIRLNNLGAGVFFTLNRTDGKGFRSQNINAIRAVAVDLDGAPLEPVQGFKLKPQIIVESSKGRYHAYWIIDKTKPLHLAMFEPVQSRIAELFNGDPSIKDLPRVLRLPGFFHKKATPFMTNLVTTHESPPSYSADDILNAFGISQAGKTKTLPIAIPQGQREQRLVSFAGSMRRVGGTEESILAALKVENSRCIPPLEISELVRIAHSVAKYPVVSADFIRDKDGKIYANSQTNVKIAIEKLDVRLQYDEFAMRMEYKRSEDIEPKHLDEKAIIRLWLETDELFAFRPSWDFFYKILTDQAVNRGSYHPVRQYLDKLRWDNTPRLEDWLIKYGGAADSEYARAVGRLVLLAAVRRIRQPGCKFDEMLVMESTQGKDKSSVLKALCPKEKWFSDNLPLDADSKEVIEQTSGKWILEAAELSGMRKGDVEHLKSFLSRDTDIARLSYERTTVERQRHFIIVGTTNSNEYLKDNTGNRRFWPIRTPSFDITALRKDRDQIWAEAAYIEASGASIRLDPALWSIAEIQQDRRRIQDPWEMTLAQCLDGAYGKITHEDVWKIVGVYDRAKRTTNDNGRISDSMRRLGFDRHSIRDEDNKVKSGYVKGEDKDERAHLIKVMVEDGDPVVKIFPPHMPVTEQWEKPAPQDGASVEKAVTP